ncbi:cache domain-containing protein [Vogesella sp. LIG4]|uniref:PAS domain S-box protein n=1 Tax=Vogesella sp. LIG4 TaxID=1192162 RepID=UPI00081FBB83|nr:cache domain-containing protein [Vogesella sp. LIG4]SCK16131.1 PAS domain S-box-containing protein [Vogesella sp. LIG4]
MLQTFWPGSLQARLALFCSVAILLVSLLLSGVGYLQDCARLRRLQLQHAEDTVSRLADDIDERVRSRQVQLEQAAANLQPSAAEVRSQAEDIIRRFRLLKGSFNSIELYSADGRIVADYPALPGRVGVDASDRDYFARTRQLLRPVVSGPLQARGSLQRNVVMFTAPILDAHGQFAGMLGGSLELSATEFFGDLRGMSLGNSGYITLTARPSRQLILHPQREQLLRVVQPAANSTLARALRGENGSEVSDGDGGNLLVYRNLHNVDWLLTGVEPTQEAYAPLADIGNEYLVLLALALLLAVPLAWRGAQRLLQPLTALQRKIRAMPAGEDAAIAVEGCDELQTLATTVADVYAERRSMADKLAMREAMFRALHNTSPLGVFVCDADGVLSYGNKAMLAMAGMERSASYWFGRRWLEAVHSSDYQQLQADWRQWSRDGGSGEFRRQFRLNHVRHEPLRVALRCSRLGEGGAPRYLAVLEDISERETTRSALQAERERLQGLLQGVGDAVILTSQHDEVLQLNMPARQLLGVKLEEAQGRSLSLFVALNLPERGQPVSLAMLTELHREETLALDLLGRDLRRLPVLLNLSVVAATGDMQGYKVWVLREDAARRRLLSQPGEAERDSGTGLANRRGMLAALAGLLADDLGSTQPHCVAWLELKQDGVPLDNTQQGSEAQLQLVAAVLQRRLRNSDCIAHLEGGAFALLLYRCQTGHAERILQSICGEIARLHPAAADSSALTASVGITALQAGDAVAQEVLQRAERRSRQARVAAADK